MRTHQRDLRSELEGWSDEPARSWQPGVGDVLVGQLVAYRQGQGQYGSAWIAQIRDEQSRELRAFWLFHRYALEEFKRLQPKPGERVGIRRLEDGGTENPYRRFAVVVDREGEAGLPDFEALAESAHDAPAEPSDPAASLFD